jgi:hypothetical protein
MSLKNKEKDNNNKEWNEWGGKESEKRKKQS